MTNLLISYCRTATSEAMSTLVCEMPFGDWEAKGPQTPAQKFVAEYAAGVDPGNYKDGSWTSMIFTRRRVPQLQWRHLSRRIPNVGVDEGPLRAV